MLFTTPDSRRRELRDYMLSFFLRLLVLNFILIFVFSFELFAVENEWFKFSDNDSRGGWLSGDMIFSIPDDSKLAKKRRGNSSNDYTNERTNMGTRARKEKTY